MAYKIRYFVKIVVKSKYTHNATFYVFAREKEIEKENQGERDRQEQPLNTNNLCPLSHIISMG